MGSNKTLVAYESKRGATEESARKIVDTLPSKFQLDVDLVDLRVQSISNRFLYQNIVVDDRVRAGKVYCMSILRKKYLTPLI
jgi:menaquinone-dependent protoporphyrinogen IX oxidase